MVDDDDRDRPPREPTAKAVLADPTLDPELAETLQRWFGSSAESEAPPEPELPREVFMERVDALLAEAADPRLVARLGGERHIRVLQPMRSRLLDGPAAFEPRLGLRLRVPELYTLDPPEDIEDIVHEDNTPQALLRDLHRLEWEFDLYIEPEILATDMPWESPQQQAVAEAMRRLRRPDEIKGIKGSAFAAVDGLRDTVKIPSQLGRPAPRSDDKDSPR